VHGSEGDKVTLSRPRRKTALFGFALIAFAALLAGFLTSTPQVAEVAHAAACKASNGICIYNRTAAVDVDHVAWDGEAYAIPVEAEDGESWTITAYWNTNALPCQEYTESATADVSWSGSGWILSNISTTSNIVDIDICDEQTCGSAIDAHGYGYRLTAEVDDPLPGAYNLRQVVFTASSVDDGSELNLGTCTLGNSVSPTAETFAATDSGLFECGYSCSNSGTSLAITYQ